MVGSPFKEYFSDRPGPSNPPSFLESVLFRRLSKRILHAVYTYHWRQGSTYIVQSNEAVSLRSNSVLALSLPKLHSPGFNRATVQPPLLPSHSHRFQGFHEATMIGNMHRRDDVNKDGGQDGQVLDMTLVGDGVWES